MLRLLFFLMLSLLTKDLLFSQNQRDTLTTTLENLDTRANSIKNDEQWENFIKDLNQYSMEAIGSNRNELIIQFIEPLVISNKINLEKYPIGYGDINYCLGLAHTNMGAYIPAIPYCETANSLTDRFQQGDTIKRMKRKIILSHLYLSTEQLSKAIKVNDEGLFLASELHEPMMKFRFLMNGGTALQFEGEYPLAISYFDRAYQIVSGANQNPYFAQAVKTNIGSAYVSSNQPDKAKGPLLSALNIAANSPSNATGEIYDQLSTIILTNDVSKVYTKLNDLDSALYFAKITVTNINKLYPNGHPYCGEFLLNLGLVYSKKNMLQEAADALQQSIDVNNKFLSVKNIFTAQAYAILGDIKMSENDFAGAKKLYQKGLEATVVDYQSKSTQDEPSIENEIISPQEVINILHKIAKANMEEYRATSDSSLLKNAYKNYVTLSQFIEHFKATLDDAKARLLFAANFKGIYGEAISSAYELHRNEADDMYISQALNWMEKNKGNELFMALNLAGLKQNSEDSLVNLESSVKAQISYSENKIKSVNDSSTIAQLKERLFKLKNDLNTIVKGLKKEYPRYYDIKYGHKNFDVKSVQKFLDKQTSLTSYFVTNEKTFYIKISNYSYDFGVVGPTKELNKMVESLIISLKQRGDYIDKSKSLYEVLAPSISNKKGQSLIIIPDGQLNYLPFESLLTSMVDGPNYLISNSVISYVPSVSYLMHPRKKSVVLPQNTMAYAPSFLNDQKQLSAVTTRSASDLNNLIRLPYAEQEAVQIAHIFNAEPRIGPLATETSFKNIAGNVDILHFATHAIINEENPEYSELLLQDDDINDGFLHTYELYNMNINADMVTLSACNTGTGKYYDGEGVMSLARGFMYAGVPNVTMSLWSVPDKSTSEIMERFYKYMKSGEGKAKALRHAKLDYLASADNNTAAPYYWAGFVFIGDPSTNKNNNLWIIIVVAAGLVSALVFYRTRRNRSKRIE